MDGWEWMGTPIVARISNSVNSPINFYYQVNFIIYFFYPAIIWQQWNVISIVARNTETIKI